MANLPFNSPIDREQFLFIIQSIQVFLTMTAFSLMASANTSHHLNYHYGFYSSLTFFVWVGVFGFLLALFILAAKFVTIVTHEIRDAIEIYGTGTMLWACYTAAVAASATSSNLHTTFDQNEGSWCSPRHHTGRLMAGAYFCSRMVAAIVIMYILVASYAASLFTLVCYSFFMHSPMIIFDRSYRKQILPVEDILERPLHHMAVMMILVKQLL